MHTSALRSRTKVRSSKPMMRLVPTLALVAMSGASVAAQPSLALVSNTGTIFTLQVGVFGMRAKAERIAADLPGSWVQEVRRGDRLSFRVNVRKFTRRSDAVRVQWELSDRGYKAMLTELVP